MNDNDLLKIRREEQKDMEASIEASGRNSKRYYWMKLKNTFFSQQAIKRLRKIPRGDTYMIIYLKMMMHTIEKEGVFVFEDIESSFEKTMKKHHVDYEMIVGEMLFHCYPVFPICNEGKQGWDQMISLIKGFHKNA